MTPSCHTCHEPDVADKCPSCTFQLCPECAGTVGCVECGWVRGQCPQCLAVVPEGVPCRGCE